MTDIHVYADGVVEIAGARFRCALGPAGVVTDKREGDGATPAGSYPLRRVHYRADRGGKPETGLSDRMISKTDGWCDDPAHPDYNTLIRLPFDAGHETLCRDDGLYDLVVEVGYNDDPPVPGRGSAIFMHIAREGYSPTEGCVALSRADLETVLAHLGPDSAMHIHAEPAPRTPP